MRSKFRERVREEQQKAYIQEMEFEEEKEKWGREKEKWEKEDQDKDEWIFQLESELIRLKDNFTSWRG